MEIIKSKSNEKKYCIGYTQGVYDLFHIGHLNLLLHAKEQCKYLIVGVNSDELVREYKKKTPVINEIERYSIIENLKVVDEVIMVSTLDKKILWKELKFDAIFIGDDWKGNSRWEKTKVELAEVGVDVIYLPHTENISSTILRLKKENGIEDGFRNEYDK